MLVKQSTAKTITFGPVLDTSGLPYTGAIAYTDAKIYKNGSDGALDASATFTHKNEGVYALALTVNDTDTLGTVEVALNLSSYAASPFKTNVILANTYDSLVAGTDKLDVSLIQWLGTTPLALSSQQVQSVVPATQKVDVETIKTKTVTAAAAVTFPASGTMAKAGDAMALTSGERTTLAGVVWATLTSGITTVGSIGKKLADWVVGTIDTYTGNTKQTGDSYAVVNHADYGNAQLVRSTTPANTLTVDANHEVTVPDTQKVDLETIKTVNANTAITTRVDASTLAGKFAGITLVATWLRGLFRKDAMDATAKSEVNTGGGAFDEANDSNEAIRDRGDDAWLAATGFAVAGDEMDLIDAPNATALTAIGAKVEAMVLDEGDATALLAAIAAKVEQYVADDEDATALLAAIAGAVADSLATAHGSGSWQSATGFSTLDSQNVRDAMKLAPTAGDPATGSIDEHADDILADVTGLDGATAASIATALWVAADRTLSGTSGANAPTAATNQADVYATAFKDGTARLAARVYLDGADVTQADVSAIVYSIYQLDEDDARTAVAGHTAVALTVADVVFDTLQTDSQATNYNFLHTPPIATDAAFAAIGEYLVEYTITPATGEIVIVRFKVKVS